MPHLLCLGLGFSASVLARRCAVRGWSITGTSRTPEGAAGIAAAGYRGIQFAGDAASKELSSAIREATHLLVSIPPSEDGDPALKWHAAEIAATGALEWAGYLSTIGVYGDHDGAWIDEDTPVTPGNARSRRRAAAEQEWLTLGGTMRAPVQIFRLAGIYGPGRSAIDAVTSGTAKRIVKPGQVFNRIHVEDIATVLEASIAQPRAGAIYNVTDLEPAPPQDVTAYAAQLIGAAVPPAVPFESAEMSEMARSFYAENKRVSNALMIAELGVTLEYPTYREGLAAIAAQRLSRSSGPDPT